MITVSVVSTKGGVGKTTLAANYGALLADFGLRVLLIDADVQPSLSRYYHVDRRAPAGLTKIMLDGAITPECISTLTLPPPQFEGKVRPSLNSSGRIDLVLSDAPEGTLQHYLERRVDRGVRLKMAVRTPVIADLYDVVIIDTQGAVGHLQDAAILAADILISPLCPDTLTVREFTTGTLDLLERLEPSSNIGMTLPPIKAVLYRTEHTADSRTMAKMIRDEFVRLRGRVSVLDVMVPSAVAYKKAATAQMPVHWIDTKANDTMHRLCWELMPHLNGIRTADVSTDEVLGDSVPVPLGGD
jgi:chromosome partitioning related protein ParA